MISGADLKRLRERREWSQGDLANALNAALGRSYGSGSISPWENGKRPIPADVSAFVEELMIDSVLPPLLGDEAAAEPAPTATDSAPGQPGGPSVAPQPVISATGGAWGRACTELWELIATGVGMVGAATNSQALIADGAIINADKEALGAAWAKLAETNETFRKMLISMNEGGAWLQVAMVTGTTVSKCWQSHGAYAAYAAHESSENGRVDIHAAAA